MALGIVNLDSPERNDDFHFEGIGVNCRGAAGRTVPRTRAI